MVSIAVTVTVTVTAAWGWPGRNFRGHGDGEAWVAKAGQAHGGDVVEGIPNEQDTHIHTHTCACACRLEGAASPALGRIFSGAWLEGGEAIGVEAAGIGSITGGLACPGAVIGRVPGSAASCGAQRWVGAWLLRTLVNGPSIVMGCRDRVPYHHHAYYTPILAHCHCGYHCCRLPTPAITIVIAFLSCTCVPLAPASCRACSIVIRTTRSTTHHTPTPRRTTPLDSTLHLSTPLHTTRIPSSLHLPPPPPISSTVASLCISISRRC